MTTDPWQQLHEDRSAAFEAKDPCANLCYLATVDGSGAPQVRTLVLRALEDNGLGLFINSTSPKWQQLAAGVSVLVYLPSLSLQYRIQAQVEAIAKSTVDASWTLRPDTPKRLDWFYQSYGAQSSAVQDEATLLRELDMQVPDTPEQAPESAQGLRLLPKQIERLDLNAAGGPHQRQLFTLEGTSWVAQTLIP